MQNLQAKNMPEGIRITDEEVNEIASKVFTHNGGSKGKVIIYFHGGGFRLGIYPSNCEFVAEIAKRTGADIYMPDYRLAPEHIFPAALEDAVNFYKGMLDKGYPAEDILVIGDSSGCSLAVSALLQLKQIGIKMRCVPIQG